MAQKRIEYYGKFTPTGVDTSQAKRLQALSGLAESVSDIAFDIGAKIQAERGAEAGVSSGMEAAKEGQAPETKEGFLSQISIYDQAYNKAALNAYSSGVRVDGRERLIELEEQFSENPDPEQFEKIWEGYITGVTQGLPPEMAANLRLSLEEDGLRVGGNIADARRALDFESNVATITRNLDILEDDLANAVRAGDETLAETKQKEIENVLADNVAFIDPATAQERRDALEDRLVVQGALGQIDRAILDGEGALADRVESAKDILRSVMTQDFADLSPEQKSKLESSLATRINELESRLVEEDTAFNITLSDFEIKIAEGQLTVDEVDTQTKDWYTQGRITDSKMTSLRKQARSGQQKKAEITATNRQITRQFTGEADPFAYGTVDQSDINRYYDDVYAPAQEGATPEQRMLTDAIFIQKTRMIPSAVKNQTNAYLLSGDPALIMQAAQLIDRVDDIPGMFGQITNVQTKAFASNMVKLMEVMEPKEALRLSQQLTDPADQARVSARRDQIKTEKFDENYTKWTLDIVGETNPTSFQNAVSQYQAIFESYYLAGSDEDTAREQASRMLNANYKQSIFGDMMYAPEQYYAVNGSVEYARDELDALIRAEMPNMQFDKDNIYLLTDDYTARTAATGAPQYRVLILDDDGVFQQRSGYFFPDKEAHEANLRIENEALTEELRAEEEQSSIAHKRQQFEEKRAAYEERKGVPRKAVPASELYADTVLSDSRKAVADVAMSALEARRELRGTLVESVIGIGEAIEQTGKRQRSKLIEDIQEREAKD
jgi:hypothetical protein